MADAWQVCRYQRGVSTPETADMLMECLTQAEAVRHARQAQRWNSDKSFVYFVRQAQAANGEAKEAH